MYDDISLYFFPSVNVSFTTRIAVHSSPCGVQGAVQFPARLFRTPSRTVPGSRAQSRAVPGPDRSWGSSSLRADAPASALPPLHSARRGSVSVPRTQCGLGCPPFRRFPLNIVVNSLLKSSKNVLPCAEVSARAECPGRFTVRAADTTRPSVWRGVARSGSRKRTRASRRRPVSTVRAPPSRRMPRRDAGQRCGKRLVTPAPAGRWAPARGGGSRGAQVFLILPRQCPVCVDSHTFTLSFGCSQE